MRAGFAQKKCPKCGGNVFLDRDPDGWYEECLQCSHTSYLETIVDAREKANQGGSLAAKASKVPKRVRVLKAGRTIAEV